MIEDYSAKFIYKPPQSADELPSKLPISYLTDKFVVNLKNTEYCADCEAKSHYVTLQNLNFDDENASILGYMEKLQDALIFVLENVDWPVNHSEK